MASDKVHLCSGRPSRIIFHGGALPTAVEKCHLSGENHMAKRQRKYSRSAGKEVESEMLRYKRGTAKSGKGGKGGKVKSREQAIAIGLSKARKKGEKVPKKPS
jgi:hypothetical protein